MSQVSQMLERMQELSTESAVEIRKEDPEYSGLNYSSHDPGYSAVPDVTWSASAGLTYQSPYTVSNTTGPTWTSAPFNGSTNGTTINGGRIELHGSEADIRINSVSLVDTLKTIQDRLNILQPNPELEEEWDQLRELGAQYRELEKKLKEQGDMWTKLRAMSPPEVD